MNAREQNRSKFPWQGELLDLVRTMDPTARMIYAENEQGQTVGKRDPGPFVSGPWHTLCDNHDPRRAIRSRRAS